MTIPELQQRDIAPQWEALLEAVEEAVCGLDREGRFTFVNRRATEILGFDGEEMLGRNMHDLVHHHYENGRPFPHADCLVERTVRSGKSLKLTTETMFRKDGSPFVAEISVAPVAGTMQGAVLSLRDVTERLLQQEALRKSEKLAAVGQLASSIAHEINNPLESTMNLLYLVSASSTMEEVQEYTKIAQTELARVAEITLQTLRFNRHHSKPVEVHMAELVHTVLKLYAGRMDARSIGSKVEVIGDARICALEGELRQVVNNLVRNAVDVMSEGGMLSLRLHPQRDPYSNDPGVRLTVADTGEGIRPEIQKHLFEPFYTTKENMGTGLGLWVSKGIVEKHGGKIRARTRRGEGTVFSVWLPVTAGSNLEALAS